MAAEAIIITALNLAKICEQGRINLVPKVSALHV